MLYIIHNNSVMCRLGDVARDVVDAALCVHQNSCLFFFFWSPHFLLSSSTRTCMIRGFTLSAQSSGQAAVTGVSPSSPSTCLRFYRAQGLAFALVSFFFSLDFHRFLLTHALAFCSTMLTRKKSSYEHCTREVSNPHDLLYCQ